jgi:hypothetical protein
MLIVAPPELPALEPRALLIARDLVFRAGIRVIATRAPCGFAIARSRSALVQRGARSLRRRPGAAALEPEQRDVGLCLLQLRQRR